MSRDQTTFFGPNEVGRALMRITRFINLTLKSVLHFHPDNYNVSNIKPTRDCLIMYQPTNQRKPVCFSQSRKNNSFIHEKINTSFVLRLPLHRKRPLSRQRCRGGDTCLGQKRVTFGAKPAATITRRSSLRQNLKKKNEKGVCTVHQPRTAPHQREVTHHHSMLVHGNLKLP